MIEIKYCLNKQTIREGAKKNFMKCHKGWYIYSLVTGWFFIILGVFFTLQKDRFEVLPYVLIICGLIVLLKKQFYLRRVVKGVFDGKPESQEIHCKFSEDEIWMRSYSSEGTLSWEGVYDVITTDEGILLYPQKNLHQWIPRNAEMIQGDWQGLLQMLSRGSRE